MLARHVRGTPAAAVATYIAHDRSTLGIQSDTAFTFNLTIISPVRSEKLQNARDREPYPAHTPPAHTLSPAVQKLLLGRVPLRPLALLLPQARVARQRTALEDNTAPNYAKPVVITITTVSDATSWRWTSRTISDGVEEGA